MKKISSSGRKILFVATKKKAKEIISKSASEVNMPYIMKDGPVGKHKIFFSNPKSCKKKSTIDRTKEDGALFKNY
ncbi:MAG: hypothetical protein CM15mP22_1820 [Gammaproteobacteria bacterium]|nr:MAG: hypothetical protein CM15mP22_1820 [Gammaproteobacteria bacterium]